MGKTSIVGWIWFVIAVSLASQAPGQTPSRQSLPTSAPVLPLPELPFGGRITRKASESTPDFPHEVVAPKGAPNVLLILTDDVGFSATSPFGGPIPTQTFDRLAKNGLRYTQFHTTALCSPTRAVSLSPQSPQRTPRASSLNSARASRVNNTIMPRVAGPLRDLGSNGYNTAWYGKNHNVPAEWHSSQAGPFDLWPTGLGFEYF